MEQEIDAESKDKRRKIIIGVVIAVIVVAVIGIPALLIQQSDPIEATEPANIETLETDLLSLQATVAAQAETIANLQSEIGVLPGGDCVCPDWASNITGMEGILESLQKQIDDIDLISIPRYAMVVRVEEESGIEYIDATVYGSGVFPVIVTLYGEEIDDVAPRYPFAYTINRLWSLNFTEGNMMLVAVVEPVGEWTMGDIIELRAGEGDVFYAVASTGKGESEGETGW